MCNLGRFEKIYEAGAQTGLLAILWRHINISSVKTSQKGTETVTGCCFFLILAWKAEPLTCCL